jgi:hypothetical protein
MMERKFFDEKNVKPTFIILVSTVLIGFFTLTYFEIDFLIKTVSSIIFFVLGLFFSYLWFIFVDRNKIIKD